MKSDTYQDLAKTLGIDRSTVSRAVRHCPGVDSKTRKMVLEEAIRSGIHGPVDRCSVYCILPDTPTYFWQSYYRELKEAFGQTDISVRYSIYSKIYDSETVLLYLDYVKQSEAKVLIISAVLSPEITKKLEIMQNEGLYVILLSEYGILPRSAYVGSNSYQDGEQIGWWFCQRYSQQTPLILNNISGNANVAQRISGFLHSLEQFSSIYAQKVPVIRLTVNDFRNSKTIPAKYAAMIASIKEEYSCIYIPFGSIYLPLSIIKTNKLMRVSVLFGHDCFTKAGMYESVYKGYTASCNQDIARQVKTAIDLAVLYLKDPVLPDRQLFHFISSKIYSTLE